MEKVKVFILKNPVIMGLITFISIIFITLVFTLVLHFKLTIPVELLLIIFSQIAPSIYLFKFKEPISKSYKIIYALTIAISYVVFNFLTVYSSEFGKNFLTRITVFAFLIIFICIYMVSGFAGKGFVKYNQKNE